MPQMNKKAIVLTAEQNAAVEQLTASDAPIVQTLGGYAGTGKTTLVKQLIRRLPDFAVAAYTGKAAHVLRRKGVAANTIHSTIFTPREKKWRDAKGKVQIDIVYDLKLPCEIDFDGFIIDEASMINRELHDALMSFGKPIIYVGDHGQLPPIGGEDFSLMADPDIILETLHRNCGEIARFGEFLRQGNPAKNWRKQKAATGEQVHLVSFKDLDDAPVGDTCQLIVGYNKTRVLLNAAYRKEREFDPDGPIVGDQVICLRNDRKLGLLNGMIGTIAALVADEMIFRCDDKDYRVRFIPEQFNQEKLDNRIKDKYNRLPFDYAYAITCHKAQGSEYDNVMVLEQGGLWDPARWCYTAASRARLSLTWVEGR